MMGRAEWRHGLKAVLLIGLSTVLVACNESGSSPAVDEDSLPNVTGSSSANYNLWDHIDTLPYEELSDAELAGIVFMREEEKLARDVYLEMYDIWGRRIFANIADSEQTHMDTVLRLIQKYSPMERGQ